MSLKPTWPSPRGGGRAGLRRRFGPATSLVLLLALVLLAGCRDRDVNLVVVGDSLSAGHQNSCLVASSQEHGYAKVLADQAGVDLALPLVGGLGAPPCLTIAVTGNPLTVGPVADPNNPANWGTRIDPTVQPTDLAVPGARTLDILSPDVDEFFFGTILGYPFGILNELVLNVPAKEPRQSMVDQAEALLAASDKDHDAVVYWIGNNDALWAAIAGSDQLLTPLPYFQYAYNEGLSRLAASGAKLIVANVPDVTVIPHLWPAEKATGLFNVPLAAVEDALNLHPGDYVTMSGLAALAASLTNPTGPFELPDNAVTSAAEIAVIQQTIDSYNAFIAAEAQAYGAALVDINGLLNDVHANGYQVGDQTITTDYCGGVFSLDGIHPTNTGYAVTANAFIDAINARFHTYIPKADVAAVLANEPLKHFCIASM